MLPTETLFNIEIEHNIEIKCKRTANGSISVKEQLWNFSFRPRSQPGDLSRCLNDLRPIVFAARAAHTATQVLMQTVNFVTRTQKNEEHFIIAKKASFFYLTLT